MTCPQPYSYEVAQNVVSALLLPFKEERGDSEAFWEWWGLWRAGYSIPALVWLFGHYIVSDSCDLMDRKLPGSSFHGISQSRTLGWVTRPFSRDLPDPRIKATSPALTSRFSTAEPPEKPSINVTCYYYCDHIMTKSALGSWFPGWNVQKNMKLVYFIHPSPLLRRDRLSHHIWWFGLGRSY